MYSRQVFNPGFWEGRRRGDACMGHLLKGIRGPEHPLQWVKRCVRSCKHSQLLLSSAELWAGEGLVRLSRVGTSLGAALALLWTSETPDPDHLSLVKAEWWGGSCGTVRGCCPE